MSDEIAEELLPIHVTRTLRPDAESTNWFSVPCQRRGANVALSQCVECGECNGVTVRPDADEAFLRCRWSGDSDFAREQPSGTGVNGPDRVSVASIMSPETICVDQNLSLEALIQLFLQHGISGAPVVDEKGRPLGVVSKTDLLRDEHENAGLFESEAENFGPDVGALEPGHSLHLEAVREGKVRDIMTPITFTLAENATVARAAALMAYERVHRVPVVSQAGRVIGVVSALDIARWVARESGFCVPKR
jgi:CBS domain-containing protein